MASACESNSEPFSDERARGIFLYSLSFTTEAGEHCNGGRNRRDS